MLAMSITLVSCSGEDGEQGIQGKQGDTGPTGPQGPQGEQGNANVFQAIYPIADDFSSHFIQESLPVNLEENPNYSFLFYLRNSVGVVFSVPGPLTANDYYSRVFYNENDGLFSINFYDYADDSAYEIPAGEYTDIIVIAIEYNAATFKSSNTNMLTQLKEAGVDTSDYNQVAAYFGLN